MSKKSSKEELQEMITIIESSNLLIFKSKEGDLIQCEFGDESQEVIKNALKRFKSEIVYYLKKQMKNGAD